MNQELESKDTKIENPMRKIRIEKVLLSAGAKDKDLEKAKKLLEIISGMKAQLIKAGPKRRIPAFGVKPGLEIGTRVTLRGEKAKKLLKNVLVAVNNNIAESQVSDNHFSFGIREYIEIPEIEYQRDIGIRGLNITVVFTRPGTRVKIKKIKSGKLPKKQHISQEEIISYMEENFQTEFL
jgi:large subunit ribosomal protein L5